MTPLTPAQELLLSVLAGAEGALTSAEVGWREGIEPVAAWRCLDRLARRGLVERTGVASDGGRCWAITDAGRAALARHDEETP